MNNSHPHDRQIPDVQIGISIYQQPLNWIKKCISSALNQDGNYSIICTARVDGPEGCNTSTKDWLIELSRNHPRTQIIFGKENIGTYGSYKEIFKSSKSSYLCQLDADDWLEANAIDLCIKSLEANPRSSFVYTGYNEVNKFGDFVRVGTRSEKDFSLNRQLVQFNTFHLRVIRRTHYKMIGGYNESLEFTGDYDLSLRLAEQAKPCYLSKILYNYRLHGSNTSIRKKELTVKEAFQIASDALKRRDQEHIWKLNLKYDQNQNTQFVNLSPRKGPIIIAGMHRSGTSVLSLVLKNIGVNIGERLIKADNQNPEGYGEDHSIVEINRRALQRTTQNGSKQWKDWGWSNMQTTLPIGHSDQEWISQSRKYISERSNNHQFWGWKDPRNTLFLEDWIEIEPKSKVIGIYRNPWEIISALQRIKPPIFLSHPDWCLEVWNQYNGHLLSFCQKHPGHSIIVNSTSFVKNPLALIDLIKQKWGWPTNQIHHSKLLDIQNLIRPELHQKLDKEEELIKLHMSCSPRSTDIFRRLENIADLPSELETNYFTPLKPKTKIKKNVTLSIIITSFNQGDMLIEALASVEKHRPWNESEVIIVDDGSTDFRTCEVIESLRNQGYTIIRQHNQGVSSARNKALRHANGDIILFLDDDNKLLHPYLNNGLDIIIGDEQVDVVYGDRIEFGLRSRYVEIGELDNETLWKGNKIDNCALIRRSYIERCGGYCKELNGLGFEDWDLWLAGLSHPKGLHLSYLNEACFEYRVRPDSMVDRLLTNEKKYEKAIRILAERYGDKITKI